MDDFIIVRIFLASQIKKKRISIFDQICSLSEIDCKNVFIFYLPFDLFMYKSWNRKTMSAYGETLLI